MSKIPHLASKVAEFIRSVVSRPHILPLPCIEACLRPVPSDDVQFRNSYGAGFRWPVLRGPREHQVTGMCPLGLISKRHCSPSQLKHLGFDPPFNQKQMTAFMNWWDQESDPREAVDQIWPPEPS